MNLWTTKNIFEKIKFTFMREGVFSVLKKAYRRVRHLILRNTYMYPEDYKKWQSIKGKFQGQRAFLIGNGPSLNKTPLYYLKNEKVMCFNRFYIMKERLNWSPSFYLTIDDLVLKDLVPEMDEIVKDMEMLFFPSVHFRGKVFRRVIKDQENIYWLKQIYGKGFSRELPNVNQGGSVIYEGLQVLSYLGFDPIIVIGVDMSFVIHQTAKLLEKGSTVIIYQDYEDPNHFDVRYFGKNRTYHQPEKHLIDNIRDNLDFLGQNLEKFNLNILNAGYDSTVESFPRFDFENLFSLSEEEKYSLFEDNLINCSLFNSLQDFYENAQWLDSKDDLNSETESFYCSKEHGLRILQKVIYTHLPIGPFDNKYFFIKR